MPNPHLYNISGIPYSRPIPPERPHQQNLPPLNRVQFIPPVDPALQLLLPNTGLPFRAISLPQQPPPQFFAYSGVDTSTPPPPTVRLLCNQQAPLMDPSTGFSNYQEEARLLSQQQYHPYVRYNTKQISYSWQSPVTQQPMATIQPSVFPQSGISTLPAFSEMEHHTLAYTADPATAYPIEEVSPHHTVKDIAAQPEYALTVTVKKTTEKINPSQSSLNPNPVEFFPRKCWKQPIPTPNTSAKKSESSQPENKEFEEKDITKGSAEIVVASKPFKNSKATTNKTSASCHKALNILLCEPHSQTASTHQEREKISLTIKEQLEHSEALSSPLQTCELDSRANTLLTAKNDDESSGMLADETKQTETASPIPSEPAATQQAAEHGVEGEEVIETVVSTIAEYPPRIGCSIEHTGVSVFISDGSCRPKEKAGCTPVDKLPFSAQQVLQLKQNRTDTKETPHALKLLYLDSFDFYQKIRVSDGFDERGNKIKVSPREQKKQLKEWQQQLRQNNSRVRLPSLNKIKKLPSSKILLAPPTTNANIHPRSRQLSRAASSLDPKKFIEREDVINSLSAHLASHKYSDEEISEMKKIAKTKEAREFTERLEKDDLWNLEFITMYYYPFFEPKTYKLHAPFIKPVETIYCRPNLSNQPIVQHGSEYFALSEGVQALQDTGDSQLSETPRTITALASCLSIKLEHLVDGNTPANPPEAFSRQCIQWHIQLTCDLVYKMIKMGDGDTQEIREKLAQSLDGLLDSIEIISHRSSEFSDEFIMATNSLCLLLQSGPLQSLLSLQEAEVPDDIKKLLYNTVEKLENTILMILVKSLQCPEFLSITMCLLKTISDNKMFLTALADSNKKRVVRLARVTTETANELLKTLTTHRVNETVDYSRFVDKLNSSCRPVLHDVHTKVIQKINPDHTESRKLEDCIDKLSTECKSRLTKIEEEYQNYLKRLEESERKCNQKILQAYGEKKEQLALEQEARAERNKQLQDVMARENPALLETPELAAEYLKLVNPTGELLQQLTDELKHEEGYVNKLNRIDSTFPAIEKWPVLQVWVYGDIAYSLCSTYIDEFNRAARFVENFEKMKSFCAKAREEAFAKPKQYDSKWLYDKDPNQPVSLNSIHFLTILSNPEQVQTLIKRASYSASLYEIALARARNASHQLTQEMIISPGKAEHVEQMNHLHQRIAFIIEEMKQVKQHLKDLLPVPDMSDLLTIRKELFKMLRTKAPGFTAGQTDRSAGNHANTKKDTTYESLLEKSANEWKLDRSICDEQYSAAQKLEQVIEGFTALKTQLAGESSLMPA